MELEGVATPNFVDYVRMVADRDGIEFLFIGYNRLTSNGGSIPPPRPTRNNSGCSSEIHVDSTVQSCNALELHPDTCAP